MANPRFAWGIDVGNRALKAVKLVRDGAGGMRVDDIDIIEHEHLLSDAGDNKESLIANSLSIFAQKHPEKGGACAIGVSGQMSFARFIKLPPVEPKKIPEIVRFEAIQQIPFPLDDVEWSYQLFKDEASPDVEVGIFAMRKELVNEHIGKFTSAGLNVQAVQMSPLAVYNAMRYDDRIKGTTMIVDVGAENTDLIIAEGEQVWLRSIPVGGNNFTESLTKQFKLKFPKAEDLKRNAATSKYTRQILQAMRPVFDSLVAEIQRSIGFYASVHREARISRVIALGGTFRLPGLMKFLQMQLQLDVQRFDALGATPPTDGRVATLLNDNVLSVVGAYGLALQAMGEGKITSSLLPLAIRRERMWKEKTKWFAAAAALIVLGTGLSVGRVFFDGAKQDAAKTDGAEINRQMQIAQNYATAWSEVEKAGEPERKNIASLQSLTKLRDVQANILVALDRALPEPKPKPDEKVKRTDREDVLVDDVTSQYYDDLSAAVAKDKGSFVMSPDEFKTHRTTPVTASTPLASRTLVKTITASQTAQPAAPAEGGEAAPATPAGKQRGYLLTMTCTTPSTKSHAVAEIVRKALIEQTKPSGDPKEHQAFRFERVEIVNRVELKNVQKAAVRPRPLTNPRRKEPTRNATQRRFGAGAMGEEEGYAPRGRAGAARFGPDGRPLFGPGGAGAVGAGGRKAAAPGAAAGPRRGAGAPRTDEPAAEDQLPEWPRPQLNFDQAAAAAVDPTALPVILDPITGEDATTDSRLTLLIAVVLDPPPPPAPTPVEGAPTEGGEQPEAPPPAEADAGTSASGTVAQAETDAR